MGKVKNIIMVLIAIIILIIIFLIILILGKKKEKKKEEEEYLSVIQQQEELKEPEKVKDFKISENEYYNIVNLVSIYYDKINKNKYLNRDGSSFAEDEAVKQEIYNIISTEYIEKNKISLDNLYENIDDINEKVTFIPTSMDVEENENLNKYLVIGNIAYMNSSNLKKVKLFVNVDYINNTYSIEPLVDDTKIDNTLEQIDTNINNKYNEKKYSNEDLCKMKLTNYKLLALRKSEDLYNMLNKEYREKKFKDFEDFTSYIEKNQETISKISLAKYKVDASNDYKQYICVDEFNKYYIFQSINKDYADIILDTYTIDSKEFLEKYNSASEDEKVGYNVEKFISAINDKDYNYVYNLLDGVFKNNNMPSIESFEGFVERNMYENNKVDHQSIEKQGNNFVYEGNLKDLKNENSEEKSLTIIMKLLEGTEFVMSFSID